jgi:hypothetical protein
MVVASLQYHQAVVIRSLRLLLSEQSFVYRHVFTITHHT